MSDKVFNRAKGSQAWDSADVRYLLLKDHVDLDTNVNVDLDDVAALLAVTDVDECDHTNYARGSLANETETINDTNDRAEWSADNFTLTSQGGASNNTIGAIVFYVEGASDADRDLISFHDSGFPITTDGNNIDINNPNDIVRTT